MNLFKDKFFRQFFASMHAHPHDNWDFYRFPDDHSRHHEFQVENASTSLDFILNNADHYNTTYQVLADDESRRLMILLLVYRVLDHHHVSLPLNSPDYWKTIQMIDSNFLKRENVFVSGEWSLNEYYLPTFDLTLFCRLRSIMATFILKQYYYCGNPPVQPEPGDIVIDAGACWGDTAMHFAHTAGRSGQVHCFEFVPSNIEIFSKHLGVNTGVKESIFLAPYALSDESHLKMKFNDYGPASCLSATGKQTARTITIDDYVRAEGLRRVDFVKMDVEGAEKMALQGAREVIRRHKPKLAISAYHRLDDLFELPRAIQAIDPGYTFYLGHYTIHNEETVLYAIHPEYCAGKRHSAAGKIG